MGENNNITRRIMLAVSRAGCKIFRNQAGVGWIGKWKNTTSGGIIIDEPYPLRAGLAKGSSELIGWTPVEITAEMVGSTVAVFTAIKVKTAAGRVSAEQKNFINRLRADGGISGIATDGDSAVHLITSKRTKNND